MAWSRKSYLGPTEIASFVFLVLFKDGEKNFIFLNFDVKGMRRLCEFKIFLRDPGMERFYLYLLRAVKK